MSENTNEIVFAIYIGTGIFLFLLLFSFVIIYNYIKIKITKEKEILEAVFNTAESERNRIADDLHDSLGSNIAVLKMYNESLLLQHVSDEAVKTLQKNSEIIDKAIQEIHMICRNQSGKFITDNGIVHELEYLQKSVAGLITLKIKNVNQLPSTLIPGFTINLFRIVQELLQNAIKHSRCKTVIIDFHLTDSQFIFSFKDDGIGMSSSKAKDRSGMKNIAGRAKIFDGQHEIILLDKEGTTHLFVFPLNKIIVV